MFKADGEAISEEELKAEYQRLADLGYKLYYVDDHWTYYGDNQKNIFQLLLVCLQMKSSIIFKQVRNMVMHFILKPMETVHLSKLMLMMWLPILI